MVITVSYHKNQTLVCKLCFQPHLITRSVNKKARHFLLLSLANIKSGLFNCGFFHSCLIESIAQASSSQIWSTFPFFTQPSHAGFFYIYSAAVNWPINRVIVLRLTHLQNKWGHTDPSCAEVRQVHNEAGDAPSVCPLYSANLSTDKSPPFLVNPQSCRARPYLINSTIERLGVERPSQENDLLKYHYF